MAYLTGSRVALTTPDRTLIAASTPDAADAVIVSEVPTATVDPLHLDLAIARGAGGRIDPRAVGPYRLTEAERRALHRDAVAHVDCLHRADIGAEIIETPSGRPAIRLLTDGDDRCPERLGTVTTEKPPLDDLTRLVDACVTDRAGPSGPFTIGPDFVVRYTGAPLTSEQDRVVRECVEEGRRTQLRGYVPSSAPLFF